MLSNANAKKPEKKKRGNFWQEASLMKSLYWSCCGVRPEAKNVRHYTAAIMKTYGNIFYFSTSLDFVN